MNIIVLYPSNPLNQHHVDENYQEEYNAAKEIGLSVHLVDVNNIKMSKIIPAITLNDKVLYRGWMLDEESYTQLEERFGDQLITSKKDYFNAHYLPNWYKDIESLTIPSIITDEKHVCQEFTHFAGKAFLKDFVKSLKTGKGSIVNNQEDILRALKDMKHYRGVIEGGLVLREVVSLVPKSEVRFFVINDAIFSPHNESHSTKYHIVQKVVKRLHNKNLKFYSVDVATTIDGKDIVIEIGDGQVSDYVGWHVKDFVKILSKL